MADTNTNVAVAATPKTVTVKVKVDKLNRAGNETPLKKGESFTCTYKQAETLRKHGFIE